MFNLYIYAHILKQNCLVVYNTKMQLSFLFLRFMGVKKMVTPPDSYAHNDPFVFPKHNN